MLQYCDAVGWLYDREGEEGAIELNWHEPRTRERTQNEHGIQHQLSGWMARDGQNNNNREEAFYDIDVVKEGEDVEEKRRVEVAKN